MSLRFFYSILLLTLITSCKNDKTQSADAKSGATKWVDTLIYADEVHFKSLKQINFGGDNAEAYWSFDDKQLVFQSNNKDWNVSLTKCF